MLKRWLAVPVAAVVAGAIILVWNSRDDAASPAGALAEEERAFDTNDPVERGCGLDDRELVRIWRGYHRVHSEDVTTVPLPPNYSGSFGVTSHSGPWDYVQTVPLVLYGPGQISANGPVDEFASITDVYPTVGEMARVDLPGRAGRTLEEALEDAAEPPRVVVVVVWDGVGRNVLERWPNRWPNLARMEQEGTSYLRATVGSSPSITPATHSSLGTGAFPRDHGVTAIAYRTATGEVRQPFADRNPKDLKLTTFADEIDRALGNEPLVGMLAWKSWQMGMMSHGTQLEGGDADLLALIGGTEKIRGNDAFYATPQYFTGGFPGLDKALDAADLDDGKSDGAWRGHEVELHDNPGWVRYHTRALLKMMKQEGYGADEVTDLLFTNLKITDIVGHQYSIDSPEMGAVLEAQDEALGELVDYLDRAVGNYTVIVTADHGHTPSARRTGAWPLMQGQLKDDIDARFGTKDRPLVDETSAVGPFLSRDAMEDLAVTPGEVAEFLNDYTIADNSPGELPEPYADRGDEPVLAAAFPGGRLDEIMRCRFGSAEPPDGLKA
ncbi:MAG: alkaline phosphatase family protein [Actinomycetota bacterium]